MFLDGMKVLLLEDQPLIVMDLEATLFDAGAADVISFRSCVDVWDYLRQNCPDAAIVDFYGNHPLCKTIAAILIEQRIPFLIYSGTSFQNQFDDLQLEGQHWLSKPGGPEEIIAALEKVIGAAKERGPAAEASAPSERK